MTIRNSGAIFGASDPAIGQFFTLLIRPDPPLLDDPALLPNS